MRASAGSARAQMPKSTARNPHGIASRPAAMRDGHFYFVARNDDIITSAGYRIGPFDVESALVEHPAVVEAAVVGKPDAERTEIVKAFVILQAGYAPDTALADELAAHVKRRLSAHAYPREIEFVTALPKTATGKIQRFKLREGPSV